MENFGTETHSKDMDDIFNDMAGKNIADIRYDDVQKSFKPTLRLIKRYIHSLIKKNKQKDFKQVLLITLDKIPADYILAFKKQYPDKEIKVLTAIDNLEGMKKTNIHFEFFLQNRMNNAYLYKLQKNILNIEIYGLYSPAFSGFDRSRLQFLAPFVKAARMCAKKLKPDIIHAKNIPFFLGAEFEGKLPYSIKVFQEIDDFATFEVNKTETFWTVLNLVNRNGMKKLCRDKIIKKCIASLFNLHNAKRFYQMRECLEFIYQNYFKFRKYIDKCEDIDENILFSKMNQRVLKLFPEISYEGDTFYNSMYYTLRKTDFWGVISQTYYERLFKNPELSGKIFKRIEKTKSKSSFISYGCSIENVKLYQDFDETNFRELRGRNKQYLLRELSSERIKTNFVDVSLFKNSAYEIHGYLDSFYNAPLLFTYLKPDIFAEGADIALNSILKLFEVNRNCQVIINIPNGLKNNYVKSWVEFVEKNPAFNGRWVFIDGELNLNQFCASSDMILLPKRGNVTTPEHYIAMKYGCVPVAARSGIFNDSIADIFDDITYGCGFKTKEALFNNNETDVTEIYMNTLNKALNLYTKNPSSWNLLIKNAMSYDSSWNFGIIEKYNEIYENL